MVEDSCHWEVGCLKEDLLSPSGRIGGGAVEMSAGGGCVGDVRDDRSRLGRVRMSMLSVSLALYLGVEPIAGAPEEELLLGPPPPPPMCV